MLRCRQGGLIVVSARYGVLEAMLQAERSERQKGLQDAAGAASTSTPAAAAASAAEADHVTQPDRRDAGTSASTSGEARAARAPAWLSILAWFCTLIVGITGERSIAEVQACKILQQNITCTCRARAGWGSATKRGG